MILDYDYSKLTKRLTISYINDQGRKDFLNFNNINRFKSYYYTPSGKYDTYDGAKAGIRYTDDPSKFDLKEYIMELPEQYKKLIDGETFPRLYTWDIEVMQSQDGTYSEASCADNAITTISVASPELDCIVLGWRPMSDEDLHYCESSFQRYVEDNKFFRSLEMKTPTFRYICFPSEKDMLEYFLKIVAKAPVMAGWNSIKYDWQYVVNRIKNYYPDLSINKASHTHQVKMKNHTSTIGKEKIRLPMPVHTLLVDMMAVIEEDKVVMPIKESLGLDYIAQESVSANKIKYKKSLGDLYNTDYKQYVFYNCIDSVLVQLINYKFRTIDKFYIYGHYCTEKLDACFGKIALTEALVFKDFYKNGLKIVYNKRETPDRGKLVGAYVRKPSPGKYYYICCNDFASLYPSTIITCNLSFENYVGAFYDEAKLVPYKADPGKYIVIGGSVYENEGTAEKPKLGDLLHTFLDDEALAPYRADKNYFVSVGGHVYKNDKEYTFKRIQKNLKAERNIFKYLAKKLDAGPISDIEHIRSHSAAALDGLLGTYDSQVTEYLREKGFGENITSGRDLIGRSDEEYTRMTVIINRDIVYFTAKEKALKNLGNSMYGGCSHVSFYWYNMNIANDITGEARNLIHRMEHHIPEFFQENWANMDDLHRKLGITVDKEKCRLMKHLCQPIYGDTDSLYLTYHELLETIVGFDEMDKFEQLSIVERLNTEFLNKHNCDYIYEYFKTRHVESVHEFELETIAYSGAWLDVKKRYMQIIMWKDGKVYDEDKMPLKIKGLEIIKSSTPKVARDELKGLVRKMLELNEPNKHLFSQKMNIYMQEAKTRFNQADIEDISASSSVNGYYNYVISDDGQAPELGPKCPPGVRALATYNNIIKKYHLQDEPVYGGKMKIYTVKSTARSKVKQLFAYQSRNLPEWSQKYAPIDRGAMFSAQILDPFNRILSAIGYSELEADGNIQMDLFM